MFAPADLGLYTDLYQLTMAQGWFLSGHAERQVGFDWFFRRNPWDGGYVVFAGLRDVLPLLADMRFGPDALDALRAMGFRAEFLDWLRDFRFRGTIEAVREGEVVFPLEPAIRFDGPLVCGQLAETLLLNLVNYASLVATRAARLREVAGDRRIVDFGLRRAQGFGGYHGTAAAYLGGVDATSNVLAGRDFGIPVVGTQAHAWIQSFDDELTAFRHFVALYPRDPILLVDTWHTLRSGVPNAITVAREMEARGERLGGIRLDSGDLAYLSRKARAMLDEAGLPHVRIAISNQLDEYVIRSLLEQRAPIDIFGVGTRLVTGGEDSALDGVWKLCELDHTPKLKVSDNPLKTNFPGAKKVLRFLEPDGSFYGDGVLRRDEEDCERIWHPLYPEMSTQVGWYDRESLLRPVFRDGVLLDDTPLGEARAWSMERRMRLQPEYRRLDKPHVYKVGISKRLMDARSELLSSHWHTHTP